MSVFSSRKELEEIASNITAYLRLPVAQSEVPGALMERVIAEIRGGSVLKTYDFLDVVNAEDGLGWQVKSTKEATPVTWKRAKIPGADALIERSQGDSAGVQALGDAILDFCNAHAQESVEEYGVERIGYSRLLVRADGVVTYFEREIWTPERPQIFEPRDYVWKWSVAKKVTKKEQLQAFHGIDKVSGRKCFAWHGLGENQLHFSGEGHWWPREGDPHRIDFRMPSESERLSFEELKRLLREIDTRPH